jgi:hypothetical protein
MADGFPPRALLENFGKVDDNHLSRAKQAYSQAMIMFRTRCALTLLERLKYH